MAEKIVVIGSNSFSGSSFIAHCISKGLQVLGISRSKELIYAFLPYKWNNVDKLNDAFKFKQLDINRDTDAITETVRQFRPDYIINFAAQSMVAQSWEHPEHWYQTNVVGNVKLHDKIRHFDFIKKYVHVSTPEVYGSCSGKVTESNPFNPSTPYAASRAACDLHLNTFFKQYEFPVVFTRAANVYGPGQQLYRIIPRAILYIKLKKKIPLHGGGHSVRSFIHIRDVADATLRIARKGILGDSYHISTDVHISIRQLVEMICKMMSVKFNDIVDVVDERPGKDAAYILDSTKLHQELGWKDCISLEDGICETIDWVDNNYKELKKQPLEYIHKE
ncbi:MAG: GDP-mannose 4,6-dehydratase [Elusimicrobia bacterium]|nr:GDP-mannose 4,6-dehydratase [Elusimicrobiota bacterium]